MKNLISSKELCLEPIKTAQQTLYECLSHSSLILDLDEISKALTSIENFFNTNNFITYRYLDVLKLEAAHLKKSEVPYISLFDGKMNVAIFIDLDPKELETVTFVESHESTNLSEIESYVVGNDAIGQIYVNNQKAFCLKIAVEHSLRSTAKRWYEESVRIIDFFKGWI